MTDPRSPFKGEVYGGRESREGRESIEGKESIEGIEGREDPPVPDSVVGTPSALRSRSDI